MFDQREGVPAFESGLAHENGLLLLHHARRAAPREFRDCGQAAGGIDDRHDLALALVERGELICAFDVHAEIGALRKLLRKYRDLPATLADVCLVRMSEFDKESVVFTLDRDFLVYRRNGRQAVPLLAPFG